MLTTIAQNAGAAWLSEFRPFSATHGAVFVVAALLMAGAATMGRRWRRRGDGGREWGLRLGWSLFIVVFQLYGMAWYAWPTRFEWEKSLPLHICDIVVWIAPLALVTQVRLARTVLYFWGVGLSTQGFFTPVLTAGAGSPEFWLFWMGHTQIVGSAIYDAVALGYRPTLRDVRDGFLVSLAYLALITPLNVACGLNYGYVGPSKPDAPTIIDKLGEWPLRVIPMIGLTLLAFLVAWAPWALGRRWASRADRTAIERSRPEEGELERECREAARRG